MSDITIPNMPELPHEEEYNPATVLHFELEYDEPVHFKYEPIFHIDEVTELELCF
jgi:hypothetical protein